jgi:hypothetical protein
MRGSVNVVVRAFGFQESLRSISAGTALLRSLWVMTAWKEWNEQDEVRSTISARIVSQHERKLNLRRLYSLRARPRKVTLSGAIRGAALLKLQVEGVRILALKAKRSAARDLLTAQKLMVTAPKYDWWNFKEYPVRLRPRIRCLPRMNSQAKDDSDGRISLTGKMAQNWQPVLMPQADVRLWTLCTPHHCMFSTL